MICYSISANLSFNMLILKNKIWAFIPARSGSKSMKDKNIKKINSVPLLVYSINTALNLKKKK